MNEMFEVIFLKVYAWVTSRHRPFIKFHIHPHMLYDHYFKCYVHRQLGMFVTYSALVENGMGSFYHTAWVGIYFRVSAPCLVWVMMLERSATLYQVTTLVWCCSWTEYELWTYHQQNELTYTLNHSCRRIVPYVTYGMRDVVELPIQHEAKLSAV